jgi:hypothetical protein
MFKKKSDDAPTALAEPMPAAQPETPHVTPAPTPATVRVQVLRPLHEGVQTYRPEDEFNATPARAQDLARLGLVAILDPSAPPPPPKLQTAREQAARAETEAQARSRERGQIEKELETADAQVDVARRAVSGAEGLEAVKAVHDALAGLERIRDAQRQLLTNVATRAQDAASKAQAARSVLLDLEHRAAWLRSEGIPAEERHLADCQREHERLLREAEGYHQSRVRPAEEALAKLRAELAGLEG